MKIEDLIHRDLNPIPWSEGDNIPWHEPGFSARMLKVHLDQSTDLASRRFNIIDEHVAWIHGGVLNALPAKILDLGCGPGLYASRLAKLGHTCTGIDYSPASIEYARQKAAEEGSNCVYLFGDLRKVQYGEGFNLAMQIYGEFNVFKPEDGHLILEKAINALAPGGKLLMEVSSYEWVYDQGHQPATWYTANSGVFSDQPYLCLTENIFHGDGNVTIQRHWIVDVSTGAIQLYSSNYQAYTHAELSTLLESVGFENVEFHPCFSSDDVDEVEKWIMVVANKPGIHPIE
jgi:SAM-dependent methyltransferase